MSVSLVQFLLCNLPKTEKVKNFLMSSIRNIREILEGDSTAVVVGKTVNHIQIDIFQIFKELMMKYTLD